jgi:hypothetical protein
MKFTSEVNVRFTFSVALWLVSFCTNVQFLVPVVRGSPRAVPVCNTQNTAVILSASDECYAYRRFYKVQIYKLNFNGELLRLYQHSSTPFTFCLLSPIRIFIFLIHFSVALRYKPEGHGFDPRWCHSNFSLT